MTFSYFIYILIYISTTVLIFVMSALMLHPRTRIIFKAPVPRIHVIIGKLLIPWGVTYLIFLPDIYFMMNGHPWRDYYYNIVSLATIIISLSVLVWSTMSFFQQETQQRVLQPLILTLPVSLLVYYMVNPSLEVIQQFSYACLMELALFMVYYVRSYLNFVNAIRSNYSNISHAMFYGIWAQWVISFLTILVFIVAAVFDTPFWNIVNMLINILTLAIFIYTSEHLMPLPDDVEVRAQDAFSYLKGEEIRKALHEECEEKLLFRDPNLSLSSLALAIGTNRTYLSRWFADNDTTFYSYINGLRTRYAGDLLRNTNRTVLDIQNESGFTNKNTFRKYFLSFYGCLPSDYRRE